MSVKQREEFEGKPLEHVADLMAKGEPESRLAHWARAEFYLRQTQFQERAAQAAEATARSTAQYTRYMFWSVLVLAASVLASFVLQLLGFLGR